MSSVNNTEHTGLLPPPKDEPLRVSCCAAWFVFLIRAAWVSFMIWLLHCTTRLVEGGGLVSNPYDVPVWVKTAYMGIYQLFCVGEGCGVVSGSDGMPLL